MDLSVECNGLPLLQRPGAHSDEGARVGAREDYSPWSRVKMSMLSIPDALTEHGRVASTSWHCRAPVEGSSPSSKSDRVQVSVEVLPRLKI